MGTRSLTTFLDGDYVICCIYRQFDGYPEEHGVELARLCNVQLLNGFNPEKHKMGTHANGIGCLAAQVVAGLKTSIGHIYLVRPGDDDFIDFRYIVSTYKDKVMMRLDKPHFFGEPSDFLQRYERVKA